MTKNQKTLAIVGGGVALVGVAAYLILKPSTSPSASGGASNPPPTSSQLQPPVNAPAAPTATSNAKYSMPFIQGGNFALVVGDTVEFTPPGAPQAGARWEFQTVGTDVLQTFAHGDTAAGSNTAVDTGTFTAVGPGRASVMMRQFIPRQGLVGETLTLSVVVSLNVSPVLQG